jgi:hypothetical protein
MSSLAYALSIASTTLALILAAQYVSRSTPPTSAPAATTTAIQQQATVRLCVLVMNGWTCAGHANTFGMYIWSCMVSTLHIVILSHVERVWSSKSVSTQTKTRRNMIEAGEGGWCGCYAARWRLGGLMGLGGHGIDGWEEWVYWRAALDDTYVGTVGTDCVSEVGCLVGG